MTKQPDEWSLKEYRSESSPEVRIFRKNLTPRASAESESHPFVCYFTFGYKTGRDDGLPEGADANRLMEMEQAELAVLEDENLAVAVGVALGLGVKDFVFYTGNPDRFLELAARIRDHHPEFQVGCEVAPDENWSHYADFP